jgi:hypothetical protein
MAASAVATSAVAPTAVVVEQQAAEVAPVAAVDMQIRCLHQH